MCTFKVTNSHKAVENYIIAAWTLLKIRCLHRQSYPILTTFVCISWAKGCRGGGGWSGPLLLFNPLLHAVSSKVRVSLYRAYLGSNGMFEFYARIAKLEILLSTQVILWVSHFQFGFKFKLGLQGNRQGWRETDLGQGYYFTYFE